MKAVLPDTQPETSNSCLFPTTSNISQTYWLILRFSDYCSLRYYRLIDVYHMQIHAAFPPTSKTTQSKMEYIHYLLPTKPDCSNVQRKLCFVYYTNVQMFSWVSGSFFLKSLFLAVVSLL